MCAQLGEGCADAVHGRRSTDARHSLSRRRTEVPKVNFSRSEALRGRSHAAPRSASTGGEGRAPVQTQWTGGTAFRFDGYLPEGIGDFEGPLLLEVKYLPAPTDAALKDLAATIQRSAFEANRIEARGVLIIHSLISDDAAREYIQRVLANLQDLRVFVWDLLSLNDLVAKQAAKAPPNEERRPSRLDLEMRGSDEWRAKRDGYLASLKQELNDNGVAVFLGAGVSQGSNLPSWIDLVGGLFTVAFEESLGGGGTDESDVKTLSRALAKLSQSPLQLTRYLRQAMRAEPRQFVDEVAKILYKNVSTAGAGPLLDEVVDLCRPTRAGARVHAVITYNFDDLLELGLSDRKVEHLSIFHGDTYPSALELPVYHVHGFLPRDFSKYDRLQHNLLIFSEENYHRVYTDPYHWSNVVQLSTLRERTCVLLGLSLTDPNLRRLLEAGTRDSTAPRHYAYMKRLSRDDVIKVEPDLSTLDVAVVDRFLRAHHVTQAAVMEEIGVNIVWFDNYAAMPAALRDLPR